VVLSFIGLIVVLSVLALASMFVIVPRGPSVPARATLVLRPGGELREMLPDDIVGQLVGRDAVAVSDLVDALRKAKRDPRITSVLLLPSPLELPYWGKVQELRDALLDFKQSGKTLIAFLEYGGDREYYLASAADRVFLMPSSPLDVSGVASYQIFLRGALDKLGAHPDFVRIGAYKTAVNQLTEKGFTPAHREMNESLSRDLYEQLVRGIADARGKTVDAVRALLDDGPFAPEAARQAGLVDELAYFDQLDDRVAALKSPSGDAARVEGADYQRVSPRAAGIRPRSRIAVLYASGVIASGKSTSDPFNGAVVGSDTIVEQLRHIRDDDSIKGIVLRVDSPGGSAVASDVIWRELSITRDARPSRPIVASMSDLAASGGYYISMPAHVIVAQPATLTGSIGIFAGKVAIGGTLEKLGVATESVRFGTNADMNSPFTPFTPDQRTKLMNYMEGFYDTFVKKAAAARRKSPAQIHAVAQGRVWTGRQAQQHGLVDVLGGLDDAVAIAKERAGIPADEDVELVAYPPRRTLFETLAQELRSPSAGWRDFAGAVQWRTLGAVTAPVSLFKRGEPLALMPFAVMR
jgi:protease-4